MSKSMIIAVVSFGTLFACQAVVQAQAPRFGILNVGGNQVEYGVAHLAFGKGRYATTKVRFDRQYRERPIVIVSESGSAGTFIVVKAENISTTGCDIVAWNVMAKPKKDYDAEIGYAVFGNLRDPRKSAAYGRGIPKKPGPTPKTVGLPDYTIVDDDTLDVGPAKVEVALKVVVSGNISKSTLHRLMLLLLGEVQQRTGFKIHKHPTNVYVYAFPTLEHADSGLGWLAQLVWLASENGGIPRVTVDEHRLAVALAPTIPRDQFGLSEAARKALFQELVRAEWEAQFEADRSEPPLDPLNPRYSHRKARRQFERNTKLFRRLLQKRKRDLAKNNGLTLDQLEGIATEGFVKNWPWPRFPDEPSRGESQSGRAGMSP